MSALKLNEPRIQFYKARYKSLNISWSILNVNRYSHAGEIEAMFNKNRSCRYMACEIVDW